MTAEQAEQFYRSAWTLGTTLQVSTEQWPPTRAAFDEYWNTACRRVMVDDVVRGYLLDLIELKMVNPLLGVPFRPLLKFLTIGFLAPVFREALGVSWSTGKQWRFERLFLLVAFVNRFIPPFLRQGAATFCWPMCGGECGAANPAVSDHARVATAQIHSRASHIGRGDARVGHVARGALHRDRHRLGVPACRQGPGTASLLGQVVAGRCGHRRTGEATVLWPALLLLPGGCSGTD